MYTHCTPTLKSFFSFLFRGFAYGETGYRDQSQKKGLRPSFRLKFTIEQSDMLLRVQLAEDVEGSHFQISLGGFMMFRHSVTIQDESQAKFSVLACHGKCSTLKIVAQRSHE